MDIVTLAFNRPDFIELQLNSIKKFYSNFTYTVFDNCPDDSIKNECERLGVKCVPIKILGNDPSIVCGLSLNKMWETLQHNEGELLYIDSDMFLINELPKFDCDFAFVPQVRKEIVYPWTGLMYFNMDTLPCPEDLKWQVDKSVPDTDVGGRNHFYLKDHNLRVQELEMWTLINNGEYGFNGVSGAKWDGNFSIMSALTKDFPTPVSVDMFKVKGEAFDTCFVFHYKSASNYPDFYTPDYNSLKTEALTKLLCK